MQAKRFVFIVCAAFGAVMFGLAMDRPGRQPVFSDVNMTCFLGELAIGSEEEPFMLVLFVGENSDRQSRLDQALSAAAAVTRAPADVLPRLAEVNPEQALGAGGERLFARLYQLSVADLAEIEFEYSRPQRAPQTIVFRVAGQSAGSACLAFDLAIGGDPFEGNRFVYIRSIDEVLALPETQRQGLSIGRQLPNDADVRSGVWRVIEPFSR